MLHWHKTTSWAHPELEGVFDLHDPLELTGFRSPSLARSRWFFIAWDRLVPLLVCLLVLGFSLDSVDGDETTQSDESFNVALFTGSGKNSPFWDLFADFMRVAGKDLGIKLEVFYAEGSRQTMASQIREVCQRSNQPDAIVVQSFKFNGLNVLRIAERNKIPVFLVNAGLNDEQKSEIGEPGTRLKSWVGELMPNDKGAGYQLANALIDEALKDPARLGPDGKVHVIGLNGAVSDGASIQRVDGLNEAIKKRSDVATLEQVVSADWEQGLAQSRCKILHRRYPNASVIWCASDLMAVGAIAATQQRGLTPGKDVIIGGVDAISRDTMDLIKQGQLTATVGGHFMDGGWVVVLLYDFFHGVDLAQTTTQNASSMTLVTKDNLAHYQSGLDTSTWERTDFRQFSRFHHPELENYHFGLSALATVSSPVKAPPKHSSDEDASKADDRKHE